jgi:hypothetical protein
MILKLYRYRYNTEGDRNIIGHLYIDGEFFAHTLEDEKRAEGVKVYGKTAIDDGVYEVKLTYSPRFKRLMPLLLNVPRFSGIRIHGGNDSGDTLGCILVAHNTDGVRIWGTAERKLTERLSLSTEKITIEIVDAFLSYNSEIINKIN